MKVISLDTIAALRELAQNMRGSVPEARAVADKLVAKKGGGALEMLKATLRGEADKLETIASDLEEMADEAAHARAFGTCRFLLGQLVDLPEERRLPLIETIRAAPAYVTFTAPLSVPQECTATVRLVTFYDETLGEERWAVHYSNTDGDESMGDNASQEDAELRYWQSAESLGQARKE